MSAPVTHPTVMLYRFGPDQFARVFLGWEIKAPPRLVGSRDDAANAITALRRMDVTAVWHLGPRRDNHG